MPTVSSIVTAIGLRTRPGKAAVWDAVGLQIGDPAAEVTSIAVCHEVSEAVIEEVELTRPDLVVSYHPLLFRPTSRLVDGATPEGRAWRLARGGISLLVTHTDFDVAPGGTADSLAMALDLEDIVPFGPVEGGEQVKVVTFAPEEAVEAIGAAMSRAGGGRIGNYDHCSFRIAGTGAFRAGRGTDPVTGTAGEMNLESETRIEMIAPRSARGAVVAAMVAAHPYEEPAFDVYQVAGNEGFVGRVGDWRGSVADLVGVVGERLGRRGLRVAGDLDARPARVGVVPGSGSTFVAAARRSGAGALVTGDVDHHRAVAAVDAGVAVVDPGHAATELPGMRRLVELVASLDVEVVDLIGDGAGPWAEPDPHPVP